MAKKRPKALAIITESDRPTEIERIEREEMVRTPIQEFKTLPEQVAKSKICHKNWYVPELRERYKHFDRMKRIDMVFPYARLTPQGDRQETLLVDLPRNESEVEQCVLKSKILKNLGYRYVWLDDNSTLYDALMQLGE